MNRLQTALRTALALGITALLAACTAETPPETQPQAPTPPPVAGLPWEAAVGELDIGQAPFHCSAVLVAQNIVVTASHCLTVAAVNARPLLYSPGHGGAAAFPSSQGVALKWGARVNSGNIRNEDVPLDWAVVQVTPPVQKVAPLPVASLSLDQMLARVAAGARVVAAGYGASDTLNERGDCHLFSEQELGLFPDDSWLQLDCPILSGDSGGAIVLVDGGRPQLIGIIAGWGRNPKLPEKTMALAVNARNFAPYVGVPISQNWPSLPVIGTGALPSALLSSN